ncbi:transmembrane protein [Cystoisospora suis]|uniref:Transmembrane protein n=1 Tax=Cystoisospora suis TaxID=483139 RepID=A0A2C6KW97_9APIC|nr:transmembrane protein [Cystoisospora suis]
MMRKKEGHERRRVEQYAAEAMEEENDACIVDLEAKVQSLKHLSLAMRDEVQESNSLLEGMAGGLDGVRTSIRTSIKRMENLWHQGGGWSTCYLALFVIFIFVLFYFLYGKSS